MKNFDTYLSLVFIYLFCWLIDIGSDEGWNGLFRGPGVLQHYHTEKGTEKGKCRKFENIFVENTNIKNVEKEENMECKARHLRNHKQST